MATRLHSSRTHTARLLTVSPSMHCTGGCLVPGVYAPGVGVGGVPAWGGVCFGGGGGGSACFGGVSALEGCLLWVAWSQGVVSRRALTQTPPVSRILDTRY